MKKSESGLLILIMIMSIFIGLLGGFFISNGVYNSKVADKENVVENEVKKEVRTSTNYEESDITLDDEESDGNSEEEVICPAVDIDNGKFALQKYDLKDGDVITERLNQNFEVTVSITGPETDLHWTLAVNGNTVENIGDQGYGEDFLTFNFTDKYIFYNTFSTDIRQSELLVIDENGKVIRTIYQMDKDTAGLVYFEASYGYNAVVVRASRRYHSGIVAPKYGTIPPVDGFGPEDIAKFPADLVIQALYVYKINADGTIDFDNPQVIVTQTYKDFIQEKVYNSTDESELVIAMRNWLDKNK